MAATGSLQDIEMDVPTHTPPSAAPREAAVERTARQDFLTLTKARLSGLVVVTTLFGYLAAARTTNVFDAWTLVHTLIGTIAAAFASAVFNQIMEVDADARMRRTADRPLPANRIPASVAFGIGWLLAAFGIIHLAMKVNFAASVIAGLTLVTYLFVYTPMKRRSSWNTLVGAVAGALPPLIGWFGGGGGYDAGAAYLFLLLLLWQLPHFLAINWMYRDEYIRGGFVMWSNKDETGKRTALLALVFSLLLVPLPLITVKAGLTAPWFLAPSLVLSLLMVALAAVFLRNPSRTAARRLFFYTLMYLPLILIVALLAWR